MNRSSHSSDVDGAEARFVGLFRVPFVSDLGPRDREQFLALMRAWGLSRLVTYPLYRGQLVSGARRMDVWFFGGCHGAVFEVGTQRLVARVVKYEILAADPKVAAALRQAQRRLHREAPHLDDFVYLTP